MKDMTTVLNKKIVNKETNEVRLVVKIDEENRKIFSVPASEPTAEPMVAARPSPNPLKKSRPLVIRSLRDTLLLIATLVPSSSPLRHSFAG